MDSETSNIIHLPYKAGQDQLSSSHFRSPDRLANKGGRGPTMGETDGGNEAEFSGPLGFAPGIGLEPNKC
jgi:hypothetical protein